MQMVNTRISKRRIIVTHKKKTHTCVCKAEIGNSLVAAADGVSAYTRHVRT